MALGEELPEFLSGQVPRLFRDLPGASLWFIRADPALVTRATVLRSQLATTLTPDIALSPEEFEGLRLLEAHTLTHGMDFGPLFDPVTLAFSPAITGLTLRCPPHALVLFFGTQLDARRDADSDFPAIFRPPVLDDLDRWENEAFWEGVSPQEAEALLPWWVSRVNVLYDHATDPTRFATEFGQHDPASQTAWFLTLERLFADGGTLLADPSAADLMRVGTAFDLLNKAESLLGYSKSGPGFKQLLRRSTAVPRLRSAWDSMPPGLRGRFRKHTQAAYDALYDDIRSNTLSNRLTKGGVLVAETPSDKPRPMSMDDYVSRLMRAVRNTTHGMARQLRPPHDTLVATNTCHVPSAMTTVAALVMFGLVADAEQLISGAWWER